MSGRCGYCWLWLDGLPQGQLADFLLSFGQERFGEIYVQPPPSSAPPDALARSTSSPWRTKRLAALSRVGQPGAILA